MVIPLQIHCKDGLILLLTLILMDWAEKECFLVTHERIVVFLIIKVVTSWAIPCHEADNKTERSTDPISTPETLLSNRIFHPVVRGEKEKMQ